MKIPANEPQNLKFSIEAFAQLLLFISEKSTIPEQADFSFESNKDWRVRNSLAFSRPSNTSLITYLAKLVIPDSENADYSISRKDNFSVEVGKTSSVLQQKYSYNHTVGIDFLE